MQATHLRFAQFTGLAAPKAVTAAAPQPAAAYGRSGVPNRLSVEARSATRREQTAKRHRRVRGKVEGTPERPRLAVFRSNAHIYAQVIDDAGATTLAAASTLTPEIRAQLSAKSGGDVEAAKLVGTKIAELCKQKNIDLVCFDRGGFLYHGRVQALADAAREGGLSF